jgi:CHAT domain-containing protein
MLAACARGLDALDARLSTLGATELRARVTAQGGELSRLALRHAVRSGEAGRLLVWSERWRATTLTLPPVRLPADAAMTRDLVALRGLSLRLLAADPHGPATSALLQERRRLEEAVRRQSLQRRGKEAARRPRPVRLGELRGLLRDAELVELADVDGSLYAVVLSGSRPPVLHHVGPTSAAERAVAHALFALRRAESGRGREPLDLAAIGRRLQEALLGPVAGALVAPLLVIVPTGRLHAVPWSLMPVLQDRAVTVSPSAGVWRRSMLTRHDGPYRVVLVGGPGLAGGATEIRRLAERYPDAEVLADGRATSDRVLAAMDDAWLVHVAAHGTFRADSPLLSALELDDGPLTVYDLERLHRAPHRVVLSSCNSAVGAPSGSDELLGVVSALVGLGAAGVVASVVPVDDPASVPFMLALHELIHRMPLGRALAEARRSVRASPAAHNVALSYISLGA